MDAAAPRLFAFAIRKLTLGKRRITTSLFEGHVFKIVAPSSVEATGRTEMTAVYCFHSRLRALYLYIGNKRR